MKGETEDRLQGITGKHAKVLESMCQQHAGIGCLAVMDMLGSWVPKPVFKANFFQ